jgi:signal transduction histidine kinase/CheY-like chemotaxis protein
VPFLAETLEQRLMESTRGSSASTPDRSASTLTYLHSLLGGADAAGLTLVEILERLVATLEGSRAGLHLLPQLDPVAWTGDEPLEGLPWESAPGVLDRAQASPIAVAVPEPGVGDGGFLMTVTRNPTGSWLLWLQDPTRAEWSVAECSVWALAGSVLLRWIETATGPRWAEQLDRALRQDRMENANLVIRRLAHDFGNVFTSLLGFSELSLSQHLPANSPLHRYLTELHRSAQDGAQLTHKLRVLSRRQAQSVRATPPTPLLATEEARFRTQLPAEVAFTVELAANLPAVAMDTVHLQMVIGELLENAREAVGTTGTVRLVVQAVTLTREDCLDLYGAARSGAYLEFRIEDNGPGLTEQARQRVFRDPFYSSKNRKGGFGLATAYGILAAHQGGLQLVERPGVPGVIARALVPLAPKSRSNQGVTHSPLSATTARALRNERVLVVDDDPHILPMVCTTLEQAGYRVQAAASAREARQRLEAARSDPFHLILTDVLMPEESGVDLVKLLLKKEPTLRFLFMSAQVSPDFAQNEFTRDQFALLHKPFLPENLLRAVRDALDRPVRPGSGSSSGAPRDTLLRK